MSQKKKTFQLLVDNTYGVLSRIAGLFSRRGYNIDSITAGVTADPRITRITIVTDGDDEILEQIEKQLRKLIDVRDIRELVPEESVYRELMLIKVETDKASRQTIFSIASQFRANIIDVGPDSLIIEVIGGTSKIDAFIRLMSDYRILELARTGVAGLRRGSEGVVWFDD
ncbi:MAG: acetolactate synthase small subunit [Lachnospiraceae bacterium]|nr:acetolactate synthase small subunit [Lachnospiraceae bacterium]